MTKNNDNRQRFERIFDAIEDDVESNAISEAMGIIRALRCVALELSELNVAASELMSVPNALGNVTHYLEQISVSSRP